MTMWSGDGSENVWKSELLLMSPRMGSTFLGSGKRLDQRFAKVSPIWD